MNTPAPTTLGVVAHFNLLERLEPAGPGEPCGCCRLNSRPMPTPGRP